ncbi:MAG: minor capsid protein [Microviridae sp.]|nr:MAG: minor capsid protein [Microviridae sp.]
MVTWRNPYDQEENAFYRELAANPGGGEQITQQHFALDCDLNNMVKRFGIKGVPVMPIDPSSYGDFSGAPDLREALEIIRDARERFEALPALVRRRFDNNPAELYAFLQDETNVEEAVTLGLLTKRPPEANSGGNTPPGDSPGEAGKAEGRTGPEGAK